MAFSGGVLSRRSLLRRWSLKLVGRWLVRYLLLFGRSRGLWWFPVVASGCLMAGQRRCGGGRRSVSEMEGKGGQ